MADFYHKRKSIKFIGANETQTDRFTIYPSPYMVFTNGGRYTKHIYIGSERIVSKVAIDNGYNPATTPTAAYGNNTYVTRLNNKSVALNDSVEAIYTKFQLPYNGLNNDNIIPGFQPSLMSLASTASSTDNYEEYSYYIHSDHLGSTSYITDSDGEVSQHVEYVPFGEVFIEELSSSAKLNTPYLFNGKELDEETGLYYYGARYYDPRISLWLSTDPMELKYPNVSTYGYTLNNPTAFIDINGLSTDVRKNDDGTFTVVNAHNDSDHSIYVVNSNGNRTGDIIGATLRPTDFMKADDTGGFSGYVSTTFDVNNLTISGTIKTRSDVSYSVKSADASRLLSWAQNVFSEELNIDGSTTAIGALMLLKKLSANNAPLDIKTSFGYAPYTAIKAGILTDGRPIITTLRAMGNIIFGANMRKTKPILIGEMFYYKNLMKIVGSYNQTQNKGNGYNMGFPFYGEHTYSGEYIYYGYFGSFFK